MLTAPCPVSPTRGHHFHASKISGRLPQAPSKRRVAPAVSSVIVEKQRSPTKYGDRTQAPAEERRSVLSERTLWGAQRRGLAAAAPVPRAGAGGDASGTRLIWAAIDASLGKPKTKSPACIDKLGTSGECGDVASDIGVVPKAPDHWNLASGIPKHRSRRGPKRVYCWQSYPGGPR